MAPKVSIVMASFNQATYIAEALDSIRNQTFTDFELIVVNDGCTDETPAILRDYQSGWPFILLDQANQGQANSLNNGFAVAQGEYLTWTSSDNNLLPHMLATLVAALDARPQVGLVYSDWDVIDGLGHLTHHVRTVDYDRLALLRHNFVNASFLYRRSCQERVGLYDTAIGKKFDWDYWLRMSHAWPFWHVPEVLYLYRRHMASSHMQPDADRHYHHLVQTWRRREPLQWYAAKVRAWWQRKTQGQELRPIWEPVEPVESSLPVWKQEHRYQPG